MYCSQYACLDDPLALSNIHRTANLDQGHREQLQRSSNEKDAWNEVITARQVAKADGMMGMAMDEWC